MKITWQQAKQRILEKYPAAFCEKTPKAERKGVDIYRIVNNEKILGTGYTKARAWKKAFANYEGGIFNERI